MASAIIHMCVAQEVNKKLNMDSKMIALGSIAPDIAKLVGETKNRSHFLNEDAEDSIPDCNRFVKKYKKELKKPFEMGYLIHLLTDKYWFRDYVYKYIDKYSKDKDLSYTALKSVIYNDYTRLNTKLIDNHNLDIYILCNEIEYPKSKIEEIPMDKLDILIDKMSIIVANLDTKKTVMFDPKEIEIFIRNCTNLILKDLKNYGLIESV